MSHVALVIPGLDRIGGAERQVMLLAKGLRGRGWRVSVVALTGAGGQTVHELASAEIAFLSLEMRKGWADPRGWIRFHGWLRRERPDVVHAHLPHAAWLARWSRLAAPAPVVIDTLHSSWTGPLGRRLGYRLSGWLPDRVTAVSQAVADAHLAAGLVNRRTLSVLPNGVDMEVWRPDASLRVAVRHELGSADEFWWLAAGRLDPVKDYPTLLRAMVATPESARLLIAGDGPLRSELVGLSARLGLERRVRFLGFVPDLTRWLQAADAFVLSSQWEGLPMGLIEAAASGLPAVATDVPGSREVIAQGQTGWLTAPGDADALAEAMATLMETPPDQRRAMGERARRQAIERFSLETVLDHWERLYVDLLREKSQRITSDRIGTLNGSSSS